MTTKKVAASYSPEVRERAVRLVLEGGGACRMHLEEIICKRADAPYQAGRGGSWLKLKCLGREEMIVLGWTPSGGSRVGIGALQLGYRDADGGLHYAGGVGTGFSDGFLMSLDTAQGLPSKDL